MTPKHWVLAVGLLALACDKGAEEAEQAGDTEGDGDGDGDGDQPGDGDGDGEATASCLEFTDADACQAAECMWWPAMHITSTEPTCSAEKYPMCIPPPSDGGDPACVSGIPGCPDPENRDETGPFQPAWIEHPDGGWVVIDLCGNLEYDSFTKCSSGVGDAHPACNCACSVVDVW
jgi:hypothetical protein